jgi:hypothetical protein
MKLNQIHMYASFLKGAFFVYFSLKELTQDIKEDIIVLPLPRNLLKLIEDVSK